MTIKINGTNTAANPSITGTDTDTGIVYGSDQIDLSTGGTSKVTLSGSDLAVGSTSPDSRLSVVGTGSDAATRISITDGSGKANVLGRYGNLSLQADEANAISGSLMQFKVDGSEAARFDADSNFGIGTILPKAPLHVASENTTYGKNAVFGANGWIDNANYHYTDATISLLGQDASGNNKGAGIEFSTRNTANSNWLHGAMYMERDGDFVVKADGAGNYVGTEKLRLQKAGGISFNGDTASANSLKDYEEGSWTATVNFGNHITTNAAYYTKIGQMVFWHLHFRPTFAPNDTAVYQIYGLPFTSKNVTENYGWTGNIVYTANANNSNIANMRPLVEKNSTYIYFHTVGLGNSIRVLNNLIRSALVGHDTLMGGFYMAA